MQLHSVPTLKKIGKYQTNFFAAMSSSNVEFDIIIIIFKKSEKDFNKKSLSKYHG